jgi:hypothetical protein
MYIRGILCACVGLRPCDTYCPLAACLKYIVQHSVQLQPDLHTDRTLHTRYFHKRRIEYRLYLLAGVLCGVGGVALLVVSVAALLLSMYKFVKEIRSHIQYREGLNENLGTDFTILVHRFLCFYPYTANEGPLRIQYKCLVPIYVFSELKLLFPEQN